MTLYPVRFPQQYVSHTLDYQVRVNSSLALSVTKASILRSRKTFFSRHKSVSAVLVVPCASKSFRKETMKATLLILLIIVIMFHVTESRFAEEKAKESLRGLKTRSSWPELLQMDGEDARDAILEQYPELQVEIVFVRDMVSADYRRDRVRIRVNNSGEVVRIPKIG